jgi:quinol monooxygenase YgiN
MADLFIIATMTAKPGHADALRDLLLQATDAFRQEDGCLAYSLLEDRKAAGRFMTYETWRDEAALKAHMTSPTMSVTAPKLKDILDGPLTQDFLDALKVL